MLEILSHKINTDNEKSDLFSSWFNGKLTRCIVKDETPTFWSQRALWVRGL